jgi:hypothetical protein
MMMRMTISIVVVFVIKLEILFHKCSLMQAAVQHVTAVACHF